MRKIVKLLCTGVLAGTIFAAFTACDEPKGTEQYKEGTEIAPVPVSIAGTEIASFFESGDGSGNVSLIVRSLFDDGRLTGGTDCCVMINSMEELPQTDYLGNIFDYPDIDFDSYTLVIGHFRASYAGAHIVGQSLFVGSEKITVYIDVDEPGGIMLFPAKGFWGLYPKLPDIPANVVRK